MKDDTISRAAALKGLEDLNIASFYELNEHSKEAYTEVKAMLTALPSAQPELCEGCKHMGKWENEVEYGYPSPCTRCKRRVEDHYER